MPQVLQLGETEAEVTFKDIRNVHLSVHPPEGRVRISAPSHMSLDTLRVYAITRLPWIRQQQAKLRAQPREAPREYVTRESHYLWGRRLLLKLHEHNGPPSIEARARVLHLTVRPGCPQQTRDELMARWYRDQVREALGALQPAWEHRMGVSASNVFIQHMKTRWGSCNPQTGAIRLNTELAKKPRECLEYILVHELAHLLEPTHNDNFTRILDASMPSWRERKALLNRLPVRHEDWLH